MIRAPGGSGGDYAVSLEFARPCGGRDRGTSMILRGEVLPFPAGLTLVLELRRQRIGVVLVRGDFFSASGTRIHAAPAAVK